MFSLSDFNIIWFEQKAKKGKWKEKIIKKNWCLIYFQAFSTSSWLQTLIINKYNISEDIKSLSYSHTYTIHMFYICSELLISSSIISSKSLYYFRRKPLDLTNIKNKPYSHPLIVFWKFRLNSLLFHWFHFVFYSNKIWCDMQKHSGLVLNGKKDYAK